MTHHSDAYHSLCYCSTPCVIGKSAMAGDPPKGLKDHDEFKCILNAMRRTHDEENFAEALMQFGIFGSQNQCHDIFSVF